MSGSFEDIPKLIDENSGSSDEENWEEIDETAEEVKCLFSDKVFKTIDEAIDHLKSSYNFDLSEMKEKYSMDFYSYVKMINFIRHKNIKDPSQLFASDASALWNSDEFMKPVGYEPWLSYDFDELTNKKDGNDDSSNLIDQIQELKDQLAQVLEDKEKMKEAFNHLLSAESSPSANTAKTANSVERVKNGVASVSIEEDNGYFESYSHYGIHHTMLSDKVRTEGYRDAIFKNSASIKDKLVMDLGCGTSILSMFASQAGAKTVYAVDQSEIIYQAMEIAQTNGFRNIEFVKGRLEDVEFPCDKVDVIVSEWMGYFLFFEGMLDSVIYARNNYLKPGGLLLPNRCTISLVGYGNQERYTNFVEFFHEVYGFKMKCMIKNILREGHVEKCDSTHVLTKPNTICDLDLMSCDLSYSNFTYDFKLEVTKSSRLTSFVGYFDTFFSENVSFSTSPESSPTHWQQVVFYLDEAVEVKSGDQLTGKFICRRDRHDMRSLNIEIHTFGKVFTYDLN